MTDHSEVASAELDDSTIAEFAGDIFANHIKNCPVCTDEALCLTGAELQLIKIEANDDVLDDGSDVTADAMSKAWADLRARAGRAQQLLSYDQGHADAARTRDEGISRIREALKPLGIFGNSNDVDLIVAVIGEFVETYQAEQGALQEALESLGRCDEQRLTEMDALYTERTRLVVALAGLCRLMGYDAGMRDDPAAITPWTRVLLIDVPDMPSGSFQASWHIAEKDLALVAHLPEFPRPWNGHTTGEKYERLRRTAVLMGTQVITLAEQEELIAASEADRRGITQGLYAKALRTGLERHKERADCANQLHAKDFTITKLEESVVKLAELVKEGNREILKRAITPIPMRIICEKCGTLHVDKGEFATKPHHTHQCETCGLVWRPCKRNTVGVQFIFDQADDKLYSGVFVGGFGSQDPASTTLVDELMSKEPGQ